MILLKRKEIINVVRLSFSEILATALLMCMACLGSVDPNLSIVGQSLAVGFTVCIIIHCFSHISGGHVNPCITIAAVILGVLPLYLAPFYIISQCLGAIIGFAVFLQFATVYDLSPTTCVCIPHPDLSTFQATMIEMTITCLVTLVCCACWDPKNSKNTDATSVKFGILVTMVKLTTAKLTGGCMNPAAALGSVVWNNYWNDHWIYWVGPILGSVMTATLYKLIFSVPPNDRILKA